MSVHKDKARGTWYYCRRVVGLDGKIHQQKRRGYKTKKEAQIAEMSNDESPSNLTIGLLSNYYYEYQKSRVKASTLYWKTKMYSKYIKPVFENRDVNSITPHQIKEWQDQVANKVSIYQTNNVTTEFSKMYEFGRDFYNVKNNPIKRVGTIKDSSIKEIKINVWSKEEFNAFITHTHTPYKELFYLFYYTGCRIGEALALTWEDIDFENKTLRINKTISLNNTITPPKTIKSNRIIAITSILIEILKNYKEEISKSKIKAKKTDFIFGIGTPLAKTTIRREKDIACKEAGVKQIRIHDFRHTHASQLIELGLDPLYIRDRLGHEDISTTLNTYSHLLEKRKEQQNNMLENL